MGHRYDYNSRTGQGKKLLWSLQDSVKESKPGTYASTSIILMNQTCSLLERRQLLRSYFLVDIPVMTLLRFVVNSSQATGNWNEKGQVRYLGAEGWRSYCLLGGVVILYMSAQGICTNSILIDWFYNWSTYLPRTQKEVVCDVPDIDEALAPALWAGIASLQQVELSMGKWKP